MAKKENEKVKVRIRPLHGIGGYGNAGDEVWMSKEEAEKYVGEGAVEYVGDEPPAVSNEQAAGSEQPEEDHKIMKPRSRRK